MKTHLRVQYVYPSAFEKLFFGKTGKFFKRFPPRSFPQPKQARKVLKRDFSPEALPFTWPPPGRREERGSKGGGGGGGLALPRYEYMISLASLPLPPSSSSSLFLGPPGEGGEGRGGGGGEALIPPSPPPTNRPPSFPLPLPIKAEAEIGGGEERKAGTEKNYS